MHQVGVNLTPRQMKRIYSARGAANIKLSHAGLKGKVPLFVNEQQLKRMEKAVSKGKGLILRLNDQNLKAIRGSGFWNDFAKGFTTVLDIGAPLLGSINPLAGQAAMLGSNLVKGFSGNGVRASGVRASGVRASGVGYNIRKKTKPKAADCARCSECGAEKKNDVVGTGLTFLH